VSIGQTLAGAREKAGLSVEQVAAATRIRRTLVMGIENDDYSACGGDFYARGHVRTIAQTVGVDPRPLLAEFDAERPEAAPPRASTVFESETAARPERRGPNWSAAMAVALVLVLVYGVAQVLSGDDRVSTDGLDGAARPTTGAPKSDQATPTPSPSATSSAVAQAPRTKVTVAVRAKGTSWVQATTGNGKELYQGLLTDETRSFSDRSRIRLVIGNAGAVSLTVNGTPVGSPGPSGQVARLEFTPEDPAAG
jgi:cytoskeletal protein RodZ